VPLSWLVWCCPRADRLYASSKEGLKRVFGLKKSAHHLNEDEEETRMEVGNDGRGHAWKIPIYAL